MGISRRAMLGALGASLLPARDFWQETRYSQWSQREVERLLTDSPWARPVAVKGLGNLVVRWTSARPVQMALARRDQGLLSVPSAPAQFREFVLTVTGLPAFAAPKQPGEPHLELQMSTELRPRGSHSLPADKSSVTVSGGRTEVEFRFMKEEIAEKPFVDFVTRIGGHAVKCRFQLSQMRFEGAVAL